MRSLTAGLALAATCAAGLSGVAGTADAATFDAGGRPAAQATGVQPDYGKIYLSYASDTWTHWEPNADASTHAGELYAGVSYFYCWTEGAFYTRWDGRGDNIWLLTDDDTGNSGVWVSDVYLSDHDWEIDTSVLPACGR